MFTPHLGFYSFRWMVFVVVTGFEFIPGMRVTVRAFGDKALMEKYRKGKRNELQS